MPDLPPLTALERELEARLGGFSPARHRINRDETMFRAGQVAGQRAARRWRTATFTTLTSMGTLVLGLVSLAPWAGIHRGNPAPQLAGDTALPALRRPLAPVPTGSEPATSRLGSSPVATTEYLRLREQVIRLGVEALPAVRWAPLPETTGLTAGSWRPRPSAGEPGDHSSWQDNQNNKTKQS